MWISQGGIRSAMSSRRASSGVKGRRQSSGVVVSALQSKTSGSTRTSTRHASSNNTDTMGLFDDYDQQERDEDPLLFSSFIGDSILRQEGSADERDGAFAWEVADWPDFSAMGETTTATERSGKQQAHTPPPTSSQQSAASPSTTFQPEVPPSIPNYLASYAAEEEVRDESGSGSASWAEINTFSSSNSGDHHDATDANDATVLSVESNLSRTSSINSILSLKNRWTSRVGGGGQRQQQQQQQQKMVANKTTKITKQRSSTSTGISTSTSTTVTSTTTSSYHQCEVRSDVETSERALHIERVAEEEEERREEATDARSDDDNDGEEEDDDELFSGLLEEDTALVKQSRSHDNMEAPPAAESRSASTSPSKSMAPSDETAPADISPDEVIPTDRREALKPAAEGRGRRADSISTRFHWRGSKPSSTLSDAEAGHEIAEIAYVLRASLTLQSLASSGNGQDAELSLQDQVLQGVLSSELAESAKKMDHELLKKQKYLQGLHEFQGKEAKGALMTLNVGSTEQEAEAQLNLLLYGGYLISSTPLGRRSYDDGGTYRFASRKELEATYIILQRDDASSIVGCKEKILCSAIEATLAMPEATVGSLSDSIVYTAIVTSHQRGSKGKRNTIRRVRHILTYIVGADQLTIRDILRLMTWCRDYRSEDDKQRHEKNLTRRESDHEQEDRLSTLLFDEYRKRIRLQVRKWLDKSSWQRHDIKLCTNPAGRIVSHHPEDIMFMVQVEMGVVRDFLPHSNVIEVMVDILQEFSLSQIGMKHALKADWENMDIEWMCAVVNDSATLLDYIENFSIFGNTRKHPVLPTFELRKARDDVIAGYQELSREACDLLAQSMMRDLQGPVIDHIFTDRWEREGQLMKCVEATLKDYYEDLSVSGWVPQYEFCRVVNQCIDTIAEQYVAAVFAEKHEGRPFSDAKAVPARLVQDRLILMQFFSHVELEMNGRGAKSHAESCLEVLLLMSAILKADEPDDIEDEINSFYSHVGIKYGHAATMYLVDRKAGSYSQKRHDKWDTGIILIADEDKIQGSRLKNLHLDHLLANHRLNPFNLPISPASKSRDDSPTPSYDAEDDDATSYTRTIGSSDSDTTMLTNPKACFANPSDRFSATKRGKEGVDENTDNHGLDVEKLQIIGDRVITLSAEAFCWIMDSTLELCNDLQGMLTKVEEKGCQSCATEVAEDIFTSMSHESFSDFEDERNPSKMARRSETKPKKKKSFRLWKRNSKKASV